MTARKKPAAKADEKDDLTAADQSVVETPLQETVTTAHGEEPITARSDVDEPVTQSGVRVSDAKAELNEISLVVDKEPVDKDDPRSRLVATGTTTLTVNGKKFSLSPDDVGVLSNLAQSAFLETH